MCLWPELGRKHIFGAFRAQNVFGGCKCRSAPLRELIALPKFLSWIWGATSRRGEERRKGRKGGKGNEGKIWKRREKTPVPKINFWLWPWTLSLSSEPNYAYAMWYFFVIFMLINYSLKPSDSVRLEHSNMLYALCSGEKLRQLHLITSMIYFIASFTLSLWQITFEVVHLWYSLVWCSQSV